MEKICSFCNVSSKDGRRIFPNEKENSFICEYCVDAAYEVLHGGENQPNSIEKEDKNEINYDDIKPKKLMEVLNNYVIGQERAKKAVIELYSLENASDKIENYYKWIMKDYYGK
ncbi:MAG: hypothetical protein J6W17_04850 [Campylobacter sp.]|nr:hypothetical protein [Campylobacter sp.]